ncbi:hypothetical protein K470DRAFT_260723 [Piedraia hortae CBS 480.64]|uniref:Uncharacterized protein n=1 Tax=Piedraia hortae CBS 480.64 TaxID=1314780 RepID=A0A6A7BQM3_9PEZI|nr:hypothetical protein K470DRAFT_260723 [Piedraia hortae CBS 480.64]
MPNTRSNARLVGRGGARGRGKGRGRGSARGSRGGKRTLVEEAQSVPNLKRARITAERPTANNHGSYEEFGYVVGEADNDYEDNDQSDDEDHVDDETRDDLGHIGNANYVDFVEDIEDGANIAPSVTHPTSLPKSISTVTTRRAESGGPSILRAQHQRRVTAPLGLLAPRAPLAGTPVPSMSGDPLGIADSLLQTARVRPLAPTMTTADAVSRVRAADISSFFLLEDVVEAPPNVALGVAIKYIGELVTMNKEMHTQLQALEARVNEMHETKAAKGGIRAAMRQLLFWEHAGGALWGDNSAIAAELRSRGVMAKAPTQSVLSKISQIKSDLRQDLRKRLRDVHLQPVPLAFNVSEEQAKAASLWKWKVSQCSASRADFWEQWDLSYHLLSADDKRLIFERDLQCHGWEKKGDGGRGLPGRQGPSRANRLISNSWTSGK